MMAGPIVTQVSPRYTSEKLAGGRIEDRIELSCRSRTPPSRFCTCASAIGRGGHSTGREKTVTGALRSSSVAPCGMCSPTGPWMGWKPPICS